MKDPAVGKSPAMFQHISGVINDETKRLRFQVEKVLQMSMFDRQKATLKMKELDANELITGGSEYVCFESGALQRKDRVGIESD